MSEIFNFVVETLVFLALGASIGHSAFVLIKSRVSKDEVPEDQVAMVLLNLKTFRYAHKFIILWAIAFALLKYGV